MRTDQGSLAVARDKMSIMKGLLACLCGNLESGKPPPAAHMLVNAKECLELAWQIEEIFGMNELTSREIELQQLVAQGLTNDEVAAKLFIEEKTVKFHLSRIFKKQGVKNRSQLIVKVLQDELGKIRSDRSALQAEVEVLRSGGAGGRHQLPDDAGPGESGGKLVILPCGISADREPDPAC